MMQLLYGIVLLLSLILLIYITMEPDDNLGINIIILSVMSVMLVIPYKLNQENLYACEKCEQKM